MQDTMARFTARARKVLNLTLKEAEKLDDSMIHSGHLLLALMQVDGSVSQAVLGKMMPAADEVREKMETLFTFKSWKLETSQLRIIELAPDVKQSLADTVAEADKREDYDIGTEHLLLGFCSLDENSLAMQVLKQFNVSPETIRQETLDILNRGGLF